MLRERWIAVGLVLVAATVQAQAPLWQAGTNYAVGDFARTGAAVSSTFHCIQANVATPANQPPSADWQQVWPHDPPVAAAGSGPTGNDWVDFAAYASGILYYDDHGQSRVATALALDISVGNGNFVLANNRTGGGQRVGHTAYQDDYGRPAGPSVADGNTDWDNYYAGYVPAIQRVNGTNATDHTNCVSYAFNAYKAGAVSLNWTDSAVDAAPFEGELTVVAANGLNGATATQGGDRCYNAAHVWTLTGAGAATGLRWKNNSSPIYTWAPNPYANDAPKGGNAGLYQTYAIGR
jgi:hypothetical protein